MQVHIIKPYNITKDLGEAYNKSIALLPEQDWACLCDLDTMFLTPDAGHILHEYARLNPNAALMTCYTNRVSLSSKSQLLGGLLNNNSDIKLHINYAEKQKKQLYKTTKITGTISGFLMLISKRAWKDQPFPELGQCLGVDTEMSRILIANNKTILRMDGLYLWHSYRLLNGINHKKHLAA